VAPEGLAIFHNVPRGRDRTRHGPPGGNGDAL